ncbi:hypothetical protein Tco_0356828 [Tanacetum coccineum]
MPRTKDSSDSLEEYLMGNDGDTGSGHLMIVPLGGHVCLIELRDLVWNLLKDAQAAEIIHEEKIGKKTSLSKQGRKKVNLNQTLDDSIVFDDQDANHGMEYMETKEAVDEGRQSGETEEVKLTDDTEVVEVKENNGARRKKCEELCQIVMIAKNIRLVHKKEPAEMEREREERQRHDQASVDYIASLYDKVQAKMDASEELAARLQMEEREMYIIEERSKLLAEFFGRRKKLLGKYRHNQLNKKTFEEIQALYIKEQERDADFVPIRSERDEKMIDKINKKAASMDEEEVPKKPESTKVEVKQEGRKENIRKRSGRRLKMKATKKYKRQNTDFDLEEEEQLRASLKIVPDEQEEIDYEVLGTRYLIVNWEYAFYHTDRYGVPHDYYRVFRANGSSRYIKTFTKIVSRFDRLDFIELHSLVMRRFSTTTPEVIDLVLWGDLRIMFEETIDDDIWKNQEK